MTAPKRKEANAKRRLRFVWFGSLRTTITVTGIPKFRRPVNFVSKPAANTIERKRGATISRLDGYRGCQKSRTLRCKMRMLQNRERASGGGAVVRNTKSGSEVVIYRKHMPDTLPRMPTYLSVDRKSATLLITLRSERN